MVMSRSNEVNTMEWKTFSKHTKDYLDDEMSDVCVCLFVRVCHKIY